MSKVKPLGKRVLVKRFKATATKGGILLPDSAQEKPKEGQVIAVGPGKSNEDGTYEPVTLKVGDRILFSSYSGTEVKCECDEEECLILSEDDVFGVLTHN